MYIGKKNRLCGYNDNNNTFCSIRLCRPTCTSILLLSSMYTSAYFTSIGTKISQQIKNHDQIDHRQYLINRPVTTFHFHEITTQDVMCRISKLPNKKSTGHNGISAETIKILSAVISP